MKKAVRKVVPDVIDLLVTPFVTLLVMSILGLFVIGPVFHVVENYILIATKAILSMPFGLGGFFDWWGSPIDRRVRCAPHLQLA